MNNQIKDQFSGTGETNNRHQELKVITGILTSRIESKQDKITKQSYHYGFFKLPDHEQEIPVIFKDQIDYYEPTIAKGSTVQLTSTWSPGEERPSFTCSDYKILEKANLKVRFEHSDMLYNNLTDSNHNQLNLYQKLQQIQSQTGKLAKTEENKFGKYKYFTEQQALNILKPLLAEHKLTLTFSDLPESFTSQKTESGWAISYLKQAILTNSENPPEQLTFHFWARGQNTDIAKAKGCAETYAIKYFLTKFFLIPTTDELDPDVTKPHEHLNRLKNGKQETSEQIQKRHEERDLKRIADLKLKYGLDWKLSQEYKNWRGEAGSFNKGSAKGNL